MQKIQVIVLEKDKDITIRYLGKAGLIHFKEVYKNRIDEGDYLAPFKTSSDVLSRYQAITSRVSTFLRDYQINLNDYPLEEQNPIKITGEALLQSLEERLNGLLLEQLLKIKDYHDKIDRFLQALEVTDKLDVSTPTLEMTLDKQLEEIEKKLSHIELTAVGLTSPEAVLSVTRQQLEQDQEFDKKMKSLRKITYLTDQLLELQVIVDTASATLNQEYNYDEVVRETTEIYYLVEREIQILQLQSKFMQTSSARAVYFEGWVLPNQVEQVKELINEATDGLSVVIIEEPDEHDEVPTVLPKNPKIFNAFENLTYAFGYPSHTEVNSTPTMVISFSLFFGLMFADVAHGIILAIIGLFLIRYRKNVNISEKGDLTRYFLLAGDMFVLLGISSSFFGLLFGEFFGPTEILSPLSLGSIGPFYFGGFHPAHEPMKMLRLAILIGVIHISLGLGLNIFNNIRAKHRHEILISLCKLWLLWGGFSMWVFYKGLSQIQLWLSVGLVPFLGLVITPLLIIMVLASLHGGVTEGLGFSIEVFAETLSHTLSYSRLMALSLIHGAMSSIVLVLAGVEHGHFPLMGIPILAIGTAVVVFLEGLMAFIHDLRLHWVEWFSKFYSGGGIIFIPYKFKVRGTR